MERFLYRLSQSHLAGKFILKGALMLRVWQAPLARQISNEVKDIEGQVKTICDVSVEPDGLLFVLDSVEGEHIVEDANYEGVRVSFFSWRKMVKVSIIEEDNPGEMR